MVSRATGIPVSKMMQGEREKLLHIEDALHKRVVGQDEAVSLVADAIRRSRAVLPIRTNRTVRSCSSARPASARPSSPRRWRSSCSIAIQSLIRIDMSEYMEKHSVARLIGAPPGYVGFDEGGQLTEQVRRKPYSVILFDEVEKAHPDVFNVLLQALDDGRMTDGQGRTVDFKNTVIIMTSNLGGQKIQSMVDEPSELIKIAVMAEVKSHFRPEFINRIDEIVVFHALKDNIKGIAKSSCSASKNASPSWTSSSQLSDAALDVICEAGSTGIRRPSAQARDPAIDREPALERTADRQVCAGRDGEGGCEGRRNSVWLIALVTTVVPAASAATTDWFVP